MGLFGKKKLKPEERTLIDNSACAFQIESVLYPNDMVNGQRLANIGGRVLKGTMRVGDAFAVYDKFFRILKIQKAFELLQSIDTNDYVALAVAYEPINYWKLPFKKGVYEIVASNNLTSNNTVESKHTTGDGKMYTYKISGFSEAGEWVFIECNEEDSALGHEPFVELIKSIAMKWNNNEWEGQISSVGEMRYKIKNDPIDLIYQWDDLFGIVFERNNTITLDDVKTFIAHNYNIC